MKQLHVILMILLLAGCSDQSAALDGRLNRGVSGWQTYAADGSSVAGRWYSQALVDEGAKVFAMYCASCHGDQAQGTANWKQRLPDDSFPPPPLNGTAHTWHHSMSVLIRTIGDGGKALGGTMPGFGEALSARQTHATIAFIQSKWHQDIYEAWIKRGGLR